MGKRQAGDYSDGTIRRRLGEHLAAQNDGGEVLTMFGSVTGDTPSPDAEAGFKGLKRFLGRGRRLFQPDEVKHAYDALGEAEDLMHALKAKRNQKLDSLRGTLGVAQLVPDPQNPNKLIERWRPLNDLERRRLNRNHLHTDDLNGQKISTIAEDPRTGNYVQDGHYAVHKKELEQLDTQIEQAATQSRTQRKNSSLPDKGRGRGGRGNGLKWGKAALYTAGGLGAWWVGNEAMRQYQDGKLKLPDLQAPDSPGIDGSVADDWSGQTYPSFPGQGQSPPGSSNQGYGWYQGGANGDFAPIAPAPIDIFSDDDDVTDYTNDIVDTGSDDFDYRGGSSAGLKRFAQTAPPQEQNAMAEVEAKNAAEALLAPYGGDPLSLIVAMIHGTFGDMPLDEARSTMPDFDQRAQRLVEGMQMMAKSLSDAGQRIEHSTNIDFDHLQQEAEQEREEGPPAQRAA